MGDVIGKFLLFLLLTAVSKLSFAQSISWSEQTSGLTTALNSVSAPDDNNVWACGNGGKVVRSTNGGAAWTSISGAPIPATLDLYSIFAVDSMTAFVTGSDAHATYLYRIMNGEWILSFSQNGGFINAIFMVNDTMGIFIGNPVNGRWTVFGTLSGGIAWDSASFYVPQTGTETGWNNALVSDGTSLFFGTNDTHIYKTVNLTEWTSLPTTGQANSFAIWFTSSTNGMTGGTGLLFTSNGGITWSNTVAPLPGSSSISGITGFGSNWVVVRKSTAVYYSTNNGGTWNAQYTAPAGNYNHLVKSASTGSSFWGVRDNGGISKGVFVTGIIPVSNEIPTEFSLAQNYPNPFNPQTTIKFSIPNSGKSNGITPVKLVIFDALGREVTVLTNENLKPGVYSVNFDASSLSSGTYFYRIEAGGFVDTKKMVLVK